MRITLVHSAALGDTVLLIPLLRALKLALPSSHLTLVTHPAFGQLLAGMHVIDASHSADDPAHSRWFADPLADATSAMPVWARCDMLISAVSSGDDPWSRHAARFSTASRILCFQPRPPESYPRHVTDYHREQLACASLHLPPPPLPAPRQNPRGLVLLHPGSGSLAKCWPVASYIQLASALAQHSFSPTFILGDAEIERFPRSAITEINNKFPTTLCPALPDLAKALRHARLFIGNDSGPTHLAAALGIPTVAIFGPSNPVQWRPIGAPAGVHLLTPPISHDISSLSPSAVFDALLGYLTSPPL